MKMAVATGKPAVEILRFAKAYPVRLVVIGASRVDRRPQAVESTTRAGSSRRTVPVLRGACARIRSCWPTTSNGRSSGCSSPWTSARRRSIRFGRRGRSLRCSRCRCCSRTWSRPVTGGAWSAAPPEPRSRAPGPGPKALAELASSVPPELRPEALVAYGDPAEEIAKVARDRDAGLIVIGLHASTLLGPRMGSVTYRVLCLTSTLVLALPPQLQLLAP